MVIQSGIPAVWLVLYPLMHTGSDWDGGAVEVAVAVHGDAIILRMIKHASYVYFSENPLNLQSGVAAQS